jgi:hypothetical protein
MDLDRVQEIETEQEGKRFILRTPVTGDVGRVFQAVGVALPPNIRAEHPGGRCGRISLTSSNPASPPPVVLTTLRAAVTH